MRRQILLGDAAACIGDGEGRDLAAVADIEGYAAFVGKLDGIGEQVDENLAQPLLVGAHELRKGRRALMDGR